MRYGIARYTRECPRCQKLIRTGDKVASLRVDGRYIWAHEACVIPWQFVRETRRLDEEFRAVVDPRGGYTIPVRTLRTSCRTRLTLSVNFRT